jgi:ferredoxin/flavodoxin---NADP+ reductase
MTTPAFTSGAPVRLPLPPRTVVAPRPARTRPSNAVLGERLDHTTDLARFRLRLDDGVPSFQPGQYVSLGLQTDDGSLLRPYSIASAPHARDALELYIRRMDGGAFTTRLWALRPGERLWVGPPRGLFTLRADDTGPHLLIATGTGLAPMMAMLGSLATRASLPPVTLLHGVAYRTELGYRDQLEQWVSQGWLDYRPSVSRPAAAVNAGWDGATGRVDRQLDDLLDGRGPDAARSIAYLCGNDGMIEAARTTLVRHGVPETSIHAERFTPAPAA